MAKKAASKTGSRTAQRQEKKSAPSKSKATPKGKASAVGESLPEWGKSNVSYLTEQERLLMVREAAYFLAEKRGLRPGYEMDDWLEAEALVKQQLEGVHSESVHSDRHP